jgi:hypothetical protein
MPQAAKENCIGHKCRSKYNRTPFVKAAENAAVYLVPEDHNNTCKLKYCKKVHNRTVINSIDDKNKISCIAYQR